MNSFYKVNKLNALLDTFYLKVVLKCLILWILLAKNL